MGKGLSKLQRKILEEIRYGGGYWPEYREVVWDVARKTRGGTMKGKHGMIIHPSFSASFTRAVTRLEARGMVERICHPWADHRIQCLVLTETGKAWPEKPAPIPWQARV